MANPLKFELPEHLRTFSYKDIIQAAEVKETDYFEAPRPILSLPDAKGNNTPVISKSNICGIQGKAKSKKTFTLSLLAKIASQQHTNCNIVIFDTEQAKYFSHKVLIRIKKMNPYVKLKLFNLRKYQQDVRVQIMYQYIVENKPDLLFVDNVRDCIMDINNNSETHKVMQIFKQLVDEFETAVVLTLHENPSKENDKARGAIGTELQNLSETVLRVSTDKDSDITTINGHFCRNIPFVDLSFYIDEEGLPQPCNANDNHAKTFTTVSNEDNDREPF